ncbi:hypothetical protein Taro_016771 [Colocasia esculenta]|uniref:U1 small nuclear ribonucleoprotein 70 kDa n=1 Tax=Colocasia esculenta TaxID=4460 RepID=A0A843ULA5_COLES|nr:hypothetical protein [Colocasia esculenta]
MGIPFEGVEKDLRGAFFKFNKRWGASIKGVVSSHSKLGRSSEEGKGKKGVLFSVIYKDCYWLIRELGGVRLSLGMASSVVGKSEGIMILWNLFEVEEVLREGPESINFDWKRVQQRPRKNYRTNHETTEHRIKREFESYGPIKRVRLITDKEANKPRGYAFIEYVHTRDMKNAYKQADGRKVDARRVLVDVERGRTVANWRPRRLGGGLGSTRVGGEEVNLKGSGRDPQQMAAGHNRSEEPRAREDRAREDRHLERDREKSRERGKDRDREREKSPERSHDRTRDRDARDDRHQHRDRDRNRDRERERERERGRDRDRGRERDRDRERGRDYDGGREHDRERRDRDRERGRDYDRGSHDVDRSHARGRETDYTQVEPKHEERDHGKPNQSHEWYNERSDYGHGHNYNYYENQQYDNPQATGEYERDRKQFKREPEDEDQGQYDQMEPGEYQGQYDHADSDPREKEKTEKPLSGEYGY